MSTKTIKHLLDQCNELIQDRADSTTKLYDMDKVKELFVNFTRVALLTKEITQSEVLIGTESELSQLASQFKQQQQDYAKDQKFKRNCIEAIVDFIENAEKIISKMSQVDDLTEANVKAERELQKLRDELEKNVYPSENELALEKEKSLSLDLEIAEAEKSLSILKSKNLSAGPDEPVFSLFNF